MKTKGLELKGGWIGTGAAKGIKDHKARDVVLKELRRSGEADKAKLKGNVDREQIFAGRTRNGPGSPRKIH